MPPTSALESLGDRDLYELFGIPETTTKKDEITKAYRKKALKVHPDKNPDNPNAAAMFHLLTQALQVLTDVAARSAYDRCRKAKKATQERNSHLDAKRRKLKEDLEAREYSTKSGMGFSFPSQGPAFAPKAAPVVTPQDTATSQFEKEVLRLRKEGSRLVEAEQERLRQELKDQIKSQRVVQLDAKSAADSAARPAPAHAPRLRVHWTVSKGDVTNAGVSQSSLTELFNRYGKLNHVIMSLKKSGSAIIEFTSAAGADAAFRGEQSKGKFSMEWVVCDSGPGPGTAPNPDPVPLATTGKLPSRPAAFPAAFPAASSASLNHADFEAKVLARLAASAKRKQMDLSA